MSYWIYQHLGNLTPAELHTNELFARVREASDAGPVLLEFARRAEHEVEGTRWSYHRDWGRVRLIAPFRNDLDRRERRVLRFAASRPGRTIGRVLAATARVQRPRIRWRVTDGPYFDNQVATLRIRGRRLELDIDKTVPGDPHPRLERICRRPLA